MKQKLTSKTVYEPNNTVKVTVVNTPVRDDHDVLIGYRRKVTVNYEAPFDKEQLTFGTDDEISDFIAAIDFTDPQQEMFN